MLVYVSRRWEALFACHDPGVSVIQLVLILVFFSMDGDVIVLTENLLNVQHKMWRSAFGSATKCGVTTNCRKQTSIKLFVGSPESKLVDFIDICCFSAFYLFLNRTVQGDDTSEEDSSMLVTFLSFCLYLLGAYCALLIWFCVVLWR